MKRICPICKKKFEKGYKTIYCGRECAAQAWKENGFYKPRPKKQCVVCNKTFIPRNHNTLVCSEECRRIRCNERTNRHYHKNKHKKTALEEFFREECPILNPKEAIRNLSEKYKLNSKEAEERYYKWRENYIKKEISI